MADNIDLESEASMMIPALAGYLAMAFYQTAPMSHFKMTGMNFTPPDGFILHFASGLSLRVRVTAEAAPDAGVPQRG